jgi:hypothetical protein
MKGQHRSVGVGHGTKISCKIYEITGMILSLLIISNNNIARGRDGLKTVVCKKNPLWYVKKTS